MPPKAYRFMAYIDAALVQQIFHDPKRQREPHIHHDRQADDIGRRLEVAKGAAFGHPARLRNRPARLNQVSSDRAG